MYRIKDYKFRSFKSVADMHHSNYAVLEDDPRFGIKYCPHLNFETEFFILLELNHKQIPKAYDYGRDTMFKDNKVVLNQYFLVLDHMSDIDLVDYFKEKTAKNFLEQLGHVIKSFSSVCDPLEHLHSRGYIHTEIKPGHVMLDPDTYKVFIIDFELVIKKSGLIRGISRDYASPEHELLIKYLRNPPKDVPPEAIAATIGLDERADIYSVGAVMYEVLTNKQWKKVKTPPRSLNMLIPKRLEEIVMATLEDNPSNRIATTKQLKHALENIL